MVKVTLITGFWDDYDQSCEEGHEAGWLEWAGVGLTRLFTPSSEPDIVIEYSDGSRKIILGGGPRTADLMAQGGAITTLGSSAVQEGAKGAVKYFVDEGIDYAIDSATGLPLSMARGAVPGRGPGAADEVAESVESTLRPKALPGPAAERLPQDINVDPVPPDPLPLNRRIGSNPRQNEVLQQDIAEAEAMGALDIRVNQHQVNAAGERVGINLPDLQYTRPDGTRVYIEYDNMTPGTSPNTPRGPSHADRIMANDPSGVVILKVFE